MRDVIVDLRAADSAGAETLEIMSAAPRYNEWQYRRIAPYLGKRICEIGSGIGNMSQLIATSKPDLLLVTDFDPFYLRRLQARFETNPAVQVEHLELPDSTAGARFAAKRLDTVVALNVLEHIEQDRESLASVVSMLAPGGRVVILVPAIPMLHGSLDRALSHHRRYSKRDLTALFRSVGLTVETVRYFNFVGMIGWFLNSRILPQDRIPLGQLKAFDRLVPVLRIEDHFRLPLGQSVIATAIKA